MNFVGVRSFASIVLVVVFTGVMGQVTEEAKARLTAFQIEMDVYYRNLQKRIIEYARDNDLPLSYRDDDGNLVLLVGISETGSPLYETTDNAGAAVTTGVVKLRDGGGLGLNLQGEGMEVAIWDGGQVDNHIEFGSRILSGEGASDDAHATHVTGTILAAGINPSAKGMAPKARAYTYDFNNDIPEMTAAAKPDQTGTILSNHSYGLIGGWRFNAGNWQWFGDVSISNLEDWKFGFYSNAAAQWDQLSFNSPYYLIVKSAGNDRTDTGNGNFPPDCNGGSGFDCILDKSTAKNILTVGAVQKLTDYIDPSSVRMSSFSGWGPTDDGRIKPDLVAAGVSIFSTTSSPTDDQYATQSGTSMAAPNATGSLLLLQELYKSLHAGNYMRSATLKALAIHSAKEAGLNPGPDYQFGWGLLDVEAGAKLILSQDDQNIFIREEVLTNNQAFEVVLQPKPNTRIKATLVWTDPAGTPVAAALDPTKIMLVNDLDIRIVDEAGNVQFPWILNPADPGVAATRGDNIRDNVEKIEFDNPEPRNYRLIVSHKGTLRNGEQRFSLIVEYASLNDPRTAYYWIGNDGTWHNPLNWSLSSGGQAAGQIPSADHRVIVDENSFVQPGKTISLNADAACYSITWLTKNQSGLALNNNTVTIGGNLIISSPDFFIESPGNFIFSGDEGTVNNLALAGDFKKASVFFKGVNNSWKLSGNPKLGLVKLEEGTLDMQGVNISIKELHAVGSNPRLIDLRNAIVNDLESAYFTGSGLTLRTDGAELVSSGLGANEFDFGAVNISGQVKIFNQGKFKTSGTLSSLVLSGAIDLTGNATVSNLTIGKGSVISFESGSTVQLNKNLSIESSPVERTVLTASASGPADFNFTDHFKLCFDNLVISKVNITGLAVINAGVNSQLSESHNWVQKDCEKVLFPDFDVRFNCVGSLTEFTDKSTGQVSTWLWNFGNAQSSQNTSTIQHSNHVYSLPGTYTVKLTVGDGIDSRSYSREIILLNNPIPENQIILSNMNLFSFNAASEYQWYRDGNPIPNSNTRLFNFDGEAGVYFVVTKENGCNRRSVDFVITDVEELEGKPFLQLYPNPAQAKITIEISENWLGKELVIKNLLGRTVYTTTLVQSATHIDVSEWPKGIYLVSLPHNSGLKGAIKIVLK